MIKSKGDKTGWKAEGIIIIPLQHYNTNCFCTIVENNTIGSSCQDSDVIYIVYMRLVTLEKRQINTENGDYTSI